MKTKQRMPNLFARQIGCLFLIILFFALIIGLVVYLNSPKTKEAKLPTETETQSAFTGTIPLVPMVEEVSFPFLATEGDFSVTEMPLVVRPALDGNKIVTQVFELRFGDTAKNVEFDQKTSESIEQMPRWRYKDRQNNALLFSYGENTTHYVWLSFF